ncbi:hypothetical protein BayCH28_15980 [Mycolicibacterium sp. CH28]|nr:hypothetical protein BayCH28_15980 [Mycolicibacterium sp. CH28]
MSGRHGAGPGPGPTGPGPAGPGPAGPGPPGPGPGPGPPTQGAPGAHGGGGAATATCCPNPATANITVPATSDARTAFRRMDCAFIFRLTFLLAFWSFRRDTCLTRRRRRTWRIRWALPRRWRWRCGVGEAGSDTDRAQAHPEAHHSRTDQTSVGRQVSSSLRNLLSHNNHSQAPCGEAAPSYGRHVDLSGFLGSW